MQSYSSLILHKQLGYLDGKILYLGQSKTISMTSHRLINVHWKINTYIIYKMVIAGDIRRQIYVCLGCPPFMADIINEQKQ